MTKLIPLERIKEKIFVIRGKKVMIDKDLAELYGVETKALNQAVKRNAKRFPEDFMFKLSQAETKQLVTNCDRFRLLKHSSVAPKIFTEQGVTMLACILNSDRAIQSNILIIRTFAKLREMMLSHKDLAHKIEAMERKFEEHDENFKIVFKTIRQLLAPPHEKPKRKIGFHPTSSE